MDQKHQISVETLRRQVGEYYTRKVAFRVFHGSTNSTRVMNFKRSEMVDISNLGHVLKVDVERQVVIAEPNVPMDRLVKATLKHGLVPPVIPEFPGITVGGAIQGAAAESSSYRWGCFSQTVNSIEMILGNGELVTATPEDHADLFYGTAGAYGSLGLITAAEIKLIPAKRYVVITHYPVKSFDEGMKLVSSYTKTDCDFIEWIMFSKDHGAVVIGNMADRPQGKLLRFNRPWDPLYYMYHRSNAQAGVEHTDSLPLKDYLFRFNRGAFWAAETIFKHYNVPFNRLTRLVLDPVLRTRKLYQALQESAASQEWICQDLVIPKKTLSPFVDFVANDLGLYPIGLCPLKPEPRSPLQCNGIDTDLVFNVGVYGLWIQDHDEFVAANKRIESKTHELGGKKWFYAHSYYSEKEFWQIYDKKWYDGLRSKYNATTLPDIYERTRVKEQYRVSNKRGAFKTMFGLAKLKVGK